MKQKPKWAGVYAAIVAVSTSAFLTIPSSAWAEAPEEAPQIEKLTFEAAKKQLLRKSGQTQFLDLHYAPGPGDNAQFARSASAGGVPEAAAMGEKSATDQRAIVESDVFAIDPSTKNLYLLTDDRGLIVLNEKDEITGRVAASGNRPDMMYLFADKKKLVVIEQDWEQAYTESTRDNSKARTQLVQYDISDATRPKVSKVVPLDGTVVDSRVVGNVLYITSSVYPQEQYSRWGFMPSSRQGQEPKGRVTSFDLEKFQVIAAADSQLPTGAKNMIRIVEQQVAQGKYTYFALAVSPQDVDGSGWWWRRASQVEVFDITDPSGAIKPTFRTSLLGNVQKATQVHLTNGYLVAVSNYPKDPKNPWNTPWRLVAESFKLPGQNDRVIKKVEAEYRLDQIKTQAEGLTGDALDAKLATLYDDATIGLRNVFVRMEDGVLSKYIPDSSETSGDTTGLSANLRDVRFNWNDGQLDVYAFWVPQNNIDPFDLFRLNPADGKVSYIKRLQYEGWAERAIPFEYEGRRLVLSLGYIIQPNDKQMRRYPQALLLEVSGKGRRTRLEEIETITLANSGIWADYQGEDKNITFSFDAKTGKGAVLFPVSGYSRKQGSFSGGKIVGFDLTQLGGDESIFKDGSLILGESGWMKRVFEDSRSQVLRTFSDQEIAAFPSFADALKTTDEKLDAIRRIELARDMIAFLPVADGMGLQLVRRGGYSSEKQATQLRLVKRTDADSDVTKVTSKLDILGQYAGHYALKDGTFLVFSTRSYQKPSTDPNDQWGGQWVQEYGVHAVGVASSALTLVSNHVWEAKDEWQTGFSAYAVDPATQVERILQFGSALLWNTGYRVYQINTADVKKLSATAFQVEGAPKSAHSVNLLATGNGNLGLFYSLPVSVDETEEAQNWMRLGVVRSYFAQVEMKADGSGAQIKGKAVNIPGNPLGVFANGKILVTRDNVVTDIVEEGASGYRANQAPYLQSLTLRVDEASLTDSLRSNELGANGFRRLANSLISVSAEQQDQGGPIWMHRAVAFDSMPGRWRPRSVATKATLEVVNVNDQGDFAVETKVFPRYALPGFGSLLAVLNKPGSTDAYLLPIGSGSRIQVYELSLSTLSLTPKGLHSYDEYNTKSKDNELVVRIPGTGRWYYWGWYGASNPSLTLDPAGDRLFISMGLSGVFTLDVADAPKLPEPANEPDPNGKKDPIGPQPLELTVPAT
jgi:hypothetical protein